ncbi:MAG: exodeoxyribonuclease III [Anaerolineaceae bacterium]|nr:exodeoxyribonuclease III [Anaerolineaceae bacterium]
MEKDWHFPPTYSEFWNPAEQPGYKSVITLSRHKPLGVIYGQNSDKFDIEGQIIETLSNEFILFNGYFPNGRRDKTRVGYKLDFYRKLLNICRDHQKYGSEIVIVGDFNTAHNEIDLRNPRQNRNNTGFLEQERRWIDNYLKQGFIDIYREIYPNRVQYTWWTYRSNARKRNIGWRLDYFLITRGLYRHVEDVIIHEDVYGSDHCPVSL